MGSSTHLRLAREFGRRGAVYAESIGEDLALGVAPGDAPLRAKTTGNEDSLGVVLHDGGARWAVVADAHFGCIASELAVSAVARFAEKNPEPDGELVKRALPAADRELFQKKPEEDRSETTVLVLALRNRELHWAGVGDSLLLRLRAGKLQRVNTPDGIFLGSASAHWALRPRAGLRVDDLLDTGTLPVEPGDLFLLTTDGIDSDCSGLELPELEQLLGAAGTLGERLATLLHRGGTRAGGGGGDNLSVVLLQPGG